MKQILYKAVAAVIVALMMSACTGDKNVRKVDICIYGGTSAGVIAAYTAAMEGKSVLLVEPGRHLGGMTSGGLGYTDIGNKFVVTGLARDFYRRVGSHYGTFEQWVFEPHVAEDIFNEYIERAGVDVLFDHRIVGADVKGTAIRSITLERSSNPDADTNIRIEAKEYIDCSYEGDLMARAGADYTVGRESNSTYGETWNGRHMMRGHQFWDPIDPYVVPGDPASGLIWGVSADSLGTEGAGDACVQAYNYRVCLTCDSANLIPITRPEGYDSTRYELALRLHEVSPRRSVYDYFIWSRMPGDKTDINNGGGISSDMIGMNHDYPEADYERRAEIIKEHETYTKGFFYFLGHDERVPEEFRREMLRWGYPKDEYTDNDGWTHQLYVREARRLLGHTVMTEHHCWGDSVVPDPIAWAAYTMDSHNCRRIVVDGTVKNEGNVEIGGFPPYPISYGAIITPKGKLDNLLVPVCLSASHIAYGSIRMEPVFMVLGQAAATAAVMAIDNNVAVQDVDAAALAAAIAANPLADGSPAEIIIDNADADLVTYDSGSWTPATDTYGSYGHDYLISTADGGAVAFTPMLDAPADYDVYIYVPQTAATPAEISVTVGTDNVRVRPADTPVVGQTSGRWLPAGRHRMAPGDAVAITSTAPGTPADAILLK